MKGTMPILKETIPSTATFHSSEGTIQFVTSWVKTTESLGQTLSLLKEVLHPMGAMASSLPENGSTTPT